MSSQRDRREAARDWELTTLGSVVDLLSGWTPSKRRADYWNGTFPWVSAKDMKQFRLPDTQDHLTEHGVANGTRVAPSGSVLLLTRGMTLLHELPVCVIQRPMAFNQDVKALRPTEAVAGEFLPYLILGNKHRLLRMVDLAGHGTGRLNSEELRALEFPLPPLEEQRAIARVLGALDDKIELNRRMSETLEEMARALFRSWFVDFDPVRAKAEGRPSGLPPDLDALFPASFEASELGEIPAGWEVKALGEVVELAYGKALRAQDRRLGTTPVYGSNGQVGWHDEKLVDGPGIVVGRKGNPGLVRWVPTDFYPIDTTFYVVPRESTPGVHFLFYALECQNLPSIAADSAVPGLNRNLAYMSRQVVPPGPIVEHFTDSVGDTLARSHCLNEEARTLAMLRDVLLPRLVSGEFRVGTRS